MTNPNEKQFVSRGGIKLQVALDAFQIEIKNKVVLDIGSSTGGFVDCLLQNEAKAVFALDTAYGELAWKLRNDPRVVVMERTNILHLESLPNIIPTSSTTIGAGSVEGSGTSQPQVSRDSSTSLPFARNDKVLVDLVTIDAGWTKLELVLPVVKNFLKPDGKIIALLKPHYEADKNLLVKGVLPEGKLEEVKEKVLGKIEAQDFKIEQVIDSPILGGGGNREFLVLLSKIVG